MGSEIVVTGQWESAPEEEVYAASANLKDGKLLSVVRISVARTTAYDLGNVLGMASVRGLVGNHAQAWVRDIAVEAHAEALGYPPLTDLEKAIVRHMLPFSRHGYSISEADLARSLAVEESAVSEAVGQLKAKLLKGQPLVAWEVKDPKNWILRNEGLTVAEYLNAERADRTADQGEPS